jgi:hypothetical protein
MPIHEREDERFELEVENDRPRDREASRSLIITMVCALPCYPDAIEFLSRLITLSPYICPFCGCGGQQYAVPKRSALKSIDAVEIQSTRHVKLI